MTLSALNIFDDQSTYVLKRPLLSHVSVDKEVGVGIGDGDDTVTGYNTLPKKFKVLSCHTDQELQESSRIDQF